MIGGNDEWRWREWRLPLDLQGENRPTGTSDDGRCYPPQEPAAPGHGGVLGKSSCLRHKPKLEGCACLAGREPAYAPALSTNTLMRFTASSRSLRLAAHDSLT